MRKITVEAAGPQASFYQEVYYDDIDKVVTEHVYAPTNDRGEQVPVPMEITDTPAARLALQEIVPGSNAEGGHGVPAKIVESDGRAAAEFTIAGRSGQTEKKESSAERKAREKAEADAAKQAEEDAQREAEEAAKKAAEDAQKQGGS